MSSDAVLFFQQIPKMIWGFMNSFNLPGLGFTPGALIMGVISFDIIIWVISNIFDFGSSFTSRVANNQAREDMRNRTGSYYDYLINRINGMKK